MKQVVTKGIVLTRTNFGEADRIITMLTPDQGKVRLMAKGVRKIKSKLAGGIELFSVSQISYIPGKKDIHTLTSSRLEIHYANIVREVERTMLGYELLKRVNRATEDEAESEYFLLLQQTLQALDQMACPTNRIELWFNVQLLILAGHQPNLATDSSGRKLTANQMYSFDFDEVSFTPSQQGSFTAAHITFMRLLCGVESPLQLQNIAGIDAVFDVSAQLVNSMYSQYIRI